MHPCRAMRTVCRTPFVVSVVFSQSTGNPGPSSQAVLFHFVLTSVVLPNLQFLSIFNFFQFPISFNFQFLQIPGFIAGFPAIPSVHPIEPATGHATRNPIYSDLSGVVRFSTVVILCTPHQLHLPMTRPSANPPDDKTTSIQRLVLADRASASDRAAPRVTAKETAAPGPTSAE